MEHQVSSSKISDNSYYRFTVHINFQFSSKGHYRHLVHVQISKKRVLPLTHGRFEVKQLLHWDEINNYV